MANLKFIYITIGSKNEAKKLAKHLLNKKLIGCANIYNMNSLYFWKEKIEDESEWVIIAKTTPEMSVEVIEETKRVHPYEIPCITELDATANLEYSKWISEQIAEKSLH